MIRLDDVHVAYRHGRSIRPVLTGATLTMTAGERVGILGRGASGKSSLIALVAGRLAPSRGRVTVTANTGWALGSSHGFHPDLSGAENVTTLAAIAGQDVAATLAFCEGFAELGPAFWHPVAGYSPGMRAQLAYSFSMAAPRDTYLADEVLSAGDRHFRDKCEALLTDRLATAGLILVSKHARTLERFCNRHFALVRGRLWPCVSAAEAETLIDADIRAAA